MLADGLHDVTVAQLRQICVDGFPLSERRPEIMAGLEIVVAELLACAIIGDLWIDGSFMTEKIEPGDVDLALCTQSHFFDAGTPRQRHLLTQLDDAALRDDIYCDCHLVLLYPEDHLFHASGIDTMNHFKRIYGLRNDGSPKGIAVIRLLGGLQ